MKVTGLIGVFDGMHEGHLNIIKNARRIGCFLAVAVVSDKAVKKVKGDTRPLFNENHRLNLIKNLKDVDYAYLVDDFDIMLLDKIVHENTGHKLDIVVRGEDQDHIKGFEKLSEDTLVVYLKRTPDVSTTKLVEKLNGK